MSFYRLLEKDITLEHCDKYVLQIKVIKICTDFSKQVKIFCKCILATYYDALLTPTGLIPSEGLRQFCIRHMFMLW